jgi:serine/threonine protein kinase
MDGHSMDGKIMRNTAWCDRWTVIRELTPGGKGCSFLVKRAAAPAAGAGADGAADLRPRQQQCVLKTLRDRGSLPRRARMYSQAAALRTLDHPGVARYVESNADQFRRADDLYVVTEYVPGTDLESVARLSPITVERAAAIVRRLLDTLQFCHERDVIHRDIKPSHVILRDGRDDQPVLLDYGLSFNRPSAAPAFGANGDAEHNGNGNGHLAAAPFIQLPEDHGRGADKHTDVSDLTQCAGVLFYLLTSARPGPLTDDRGRRPHEREAAQKLLAQLDATYREQLARIFDVAFTDDPGRRWQSAESLGAEIDRLQNPNLPGPEDPVRGRARMIRRRLGDNPEVNRQQAADKFTKDVVTWVSETMNVLNAELKDVLTIGLVLSRSRPGYKKVAMNFIFTHRLNSKHKLECGISTLLENQDLVLLAECLGRTGEVVRVRLQDPDAPEVLRNAIESFLMETAEHFAAGAA